MPTHAHYPRHVMRVAEQPDGLALLAKKAIKVNAAKRAFEKENAEFRTMLEGARCEYPECADHLVDEEAPITERSPTLETEAAPPASTKYLQLGFLLLENPRLDYRKVGDAIWGPNVELDLVRSRVANLLTHLRHLGIIESAGGNRFRVDRDRLAQRSGRPVP